MEYEKKMEKTKSKKFISLSQGEILGFDDDEFVSINVTKLKKYFYYLIGNDNDESEKNNLQGQED